MQFCADELCVFLFLPFSRSVSWLAICELANGVGCYVKVCADKLAFPQLDAKPTEPVDSAFWKVDREGES